MENSAKSKKTYTKLYMKLKKLFNKYFIFKKTMKPGIDWEQMHILALNIIT